MVLTTTPSLLDNYRGWREEVVSSLHGNTTMDIRHRDIMEILQAFFPGNSSGASLTGKPKEGGFKQCGVGGG